MKNSIDKPAGRAGVDGTRHGVQRRRVLQAGGAAAFTAAELSGAGLRAFAQTGKTVRVGYITPLTGPLSAFGAVDKFVLAGIQPALKAGVAIAGKTHLVEVIVKDSQSNPNRAAEVAAELILKDGVDLMLVANTPETTNPVSDQCELNGVPCISTVSPWQAWFFGRGGNPQKGFDWTYHFFWGLEDLIEAFTNIWRQLPNNKVVGLLLPNDGDGNAWADPKLGLPPALKAKGYTVVDPGRYQPFQADFSAQISAFKKAGVDLVAGVPTPPDFKNFWTQARQQGFRPKAVTVGKALAFPSTIEALGDAGDGLSQELWWSPNRPYKSSISGQTAQQLAAAYEASEKRQWSQPLGFSHALFEVALDVLKRTGDISKKAAIRDAILATDLQTVVGRVGWKGGATNPVKNVCRTPLVSGQWVKGKAHKYELLVVSNETSPGIPLQAKPKTIPY